MSDQKVHGTVTCMHKQGGGRGMVGIQVAVWACVYKPMWSLGLNKGIRMIGL